MTEPTNPSPANDNRFAPPMATIEDVPSADEGELAGRGARFGAAVIDVIVQVGVVYVLSLVTPWHPFDPKAAANHLLSTLLINAVGGFVVFCLLHGYLLANRGQTIGKSVLGIKIVRKDGSKADIGRLLGLRYGVNTLLTMIPLLGGIYGLVDALMIFGSQRRCVHDYIADTIVVKN